MLDIVVLAAGKGTRMKSQLPKVLHSLAGRSFLQHVLDTARELGSDALHVVIGHGAELVEERLGADDVTFSLQAEQLGTGHAVQQAVDKLRDDATVLILFGDVPCIRKASLEKLVEKVNNEAMGLLTITLDNPFGYGRIVRDEQGRVVAIVEQKDATKDQLEIREINTGIMAFKGSHLKQWLPRLQNNNAQAEYYLTDVIALAQEDGIAIETAEPDNELEVLGVNNRLQQAQLERYYQQHLAEELMVEGVTLLDPARFDCRGTITAGEDVAIDVNCIFEGDVKLGNNVSIGPNCSLKNVTVGDNTVIKANSVLEDAVVEAGCDIGPFARLRPGTHLSEGAKIGNFVETKKALVGKGSKINHLSYVGDAELGDGVNVGAGTITCNYDGVNKFKTEIGDNAFIGSNTALVAPVKVSKGATIGAGSTITKNVDEDELAIARQKQRNMSGWERPKKKTS